MLAIKLSRVGKKKQPSFRLLVLEKSKDPWGDYLENVGFYNPKARPKVIQLKAERIKYWLSRGAQPTSTVHNLLVSQGVLEGTKKPVSRLSQRHRARLAAKKKESEQG